MWMWEDATKPASGLGLIIGVVMILALTLIGYYRQWLITAAEAFGVIAGAAALIVLVMAPVVERIRSDINKGPRC